MKSLLLVAPVLATATTANPIGQVVALLDKLRATVIADGEVEHKQFQEFADWCEDEAKERQFEIKTGKAQQADLTATIEKATADFEVCTSKIDELSKSIAAIEADMKAATAIRKKENETFKSAEKELVETVDTLRRAQQVLKKAMAGGSFVQVPEAINELTASLRTILDAGIFSTNDSSRIKAFLQESEDGVNAPEQKAYESKSGSIVETLADLQEKAEGELADARKAEVQARQAYELLIQSLKNELKVQNDALSTTKKQLGSVSETKATAQGDLSKVAKDLGEDQSYVKDLSQNCQQRAVDFDVNTKGRAEELKALEQAKKIIVDATGGATERQYSLIQTKAKTSNAAFDQLAQTIKSMGRKEHSSILVQLAGQIRATASMNTDPFGKIKGLIQDMIQKLVKEAEEEASQKAFCDKEMTSNEAKRKKLQAEESKLNTRVEKATANIAALKQEIAELNSALAHTAKSQKEMDKLRAAEHEEFIKAKADFEQGLTGVRTALKVLRDYYEKKGESFIQSMNKKSSDVGSSIIDILEIAESDFARSLAEAQAAEDDEVEGHEKTTQDNKVSTATKRASIEGKTQEAARLEQSITDAKSDLGGVSEELSAVLEYLDKLRPQCVAEPESYEDRKARREREIEGLQTALEVLESETALVQTGTSTFLSSSRPHVAIQ